MRLIGVLTEFDQSDPEAIAYSGGLTSELSRRMQPRPRQGALL